MFISIAGSRSFDMLNLEPGTVVTFVVPFQLSGFFRQPLTSGPPGGWLPGGTLSGSGLAYVNFQVATPTEINAVSAEYRFGESVTPEPATALLFATGALVIARRRRRGRPSE